MLTGRRTTSAPADRAAVDEVSVEPSSTTTTRSTPLTPHSADTVAATELAESLTGTMATTVTTRSAGRARAGRARAIATPGAQPHRRRVPPGRRPAERSRR